MIELLAIFGGISLTTITGLAGYIKYTEIKENIKTKLKEEIKEELKGEIDNEKENNR